MNRLLPLLLFSVFQCLEIFAAPAFPFAPAAGQPGSAAVHMSSSNFVGWAENYTNYFVGDAVASRWQTPEKALGKAEGTSSDIVCLGRGGTLTLTFTIGIEDGIGADFAVFENGFGDTFLELAWVEVSADGTNFVRFPNYSYTKNPIGGYGSLNPTYIYGYASKYRQGYGTPFDLAELDEVAEEIAAGEHSFSAEYVAAFTRAYPTVVSNTIYYVRLIDIVGDELDPDLDCEGVPIFDPYPTTGAAGVDIDAVGVINQKAVAGAVQRITFESIPNQQLDFHYVELIAGSDSGLTVEFVLQTGAGSIDENILNFESNGVYVVRASQPGNTVYAPAVSVIRSFHVADKLQHIFVEPVPDQASSTNTIPVYAYSSSQLPVKMEIHRGPYGVLIHSDSHQLTLTNEADTVTLRAYQAGDAAHAPAEDVYVDFQILDVPEGLIDFADWLDSNDVPRIGRVATNDCYGRDSLRLSYELPTGVQVSSRVLVSDEMKNWGNAVPEIMSQEVRNGVRKIDVLVPTSASNQYFRVEYEAR